MKRRPAIRGQKTKAIRIDPAGLELFREELKGSPEWSEYNKASESELVVLATMFARLYISPDVQVLPKDGLMVLLSASIQDNIAAVARALGGAAQLNESDMTITVAQPSIKTVTFRATPPKDLEKFVVH